MDRFYVVANEVGVRIAGLADWLFGCGHRRTTFPMTLRDCAGGESRNRTQCETYIVCLECGRHFAYDWTAMQIAKPRLAWGAPPALLPALRETGLSLDFYLQNTTAGLTHGRRRNTLEK
ncbi:MAG TPA: hypothetical protein VMR62_30155 [Bryobacteraceae bacterium]|jgi:hypothetical protein|nr:hypothetical protein [Bryobacteraceae bacterium]